jgi:4'-phosphopantetheinyl transferase
MLTPNLLQSHIIGNYRSCVPEEVRFSYGQKGKPTLENAKFASTRIAFNMSHSADIVLIAITAGTEIGIDVEQICAGAAHVETIADSCLNPREATLLDSAPPDNRTRTLLRYWTHKEAYLKAIGCGLSVPPQQVYDSSARIDQ